MTESYKLDARCRWLLPQPAYEAIRFKETVIVIEEVVAEKKGKPPSVSHKIGYNYAVITDHHFYLFKMKKAQGEHEGGAVPVCWLEDIKNVEVVEDGASFLVPSVERHARHIQVTYVDHLALRSAPKTFDVYSFMEGSTLWFFLIQAWKETKLRYNYADPTRLRTVLVEEVEPSEWGSEDGMSSVGSSDDEDEEHERHEPNAVVRPSIDSLRLDLSKAIFFQGTSTTHDPHGSPRDPHTISARLMAAKKRLKSPGRLPDRIGAEVAEAGDGDRDRDVSPGTPMSGHNHNYTIGMGALARVGDLVLRRRRKRLAEAIPSTADFFSDSLALGSSLTLSQDPNPNPKQNMKSKLNRPPSMYSVPDERTALRPELTDGDADFEAELERSIAIDRAQKTPRGGGGGDYADAQAQAQAPSAYVLTPANAHSTFDFGASVGAGGSSTFLEDVESTQQLSRSTLAMLRRIDTSNREVGTSSGAVAASPSASPSVAEAMRSARPAYLTSTLTPHPRTPGHGSMGHGYLHPHPHPSTPATTTLATDYGHVAGPNIHTAKSPEDILRIARAHRSAMADHMAQVSIARGVMTARSGKSGRSKKSRATAAAAVSAMPTQRPVSIFNMKADVHMNRWDQGRGQGPAPSDAQALPDALNRAELEHDAAAAAIHRRGLGMAAALGSGIGTGSSFVAGTTPGGASAALTATARSYVSRRWPEGTDMDKGITGVHAEPLPLDSSDGRIVTVAHVREAHSMQAVFHDISVDLRETTNLRRRTLLVRKLSGPLLRHRLIKTAFFEAEPTFRLMVADMAALTEDSEALKVRNEKLEHERRVREETKKCLIGASLKSATAATAQELATIHGASPLRRPVVDIHRNQRLRQRLREEAAEAEWDVNTSTGIEVSSGFDFDAYDRHAEAVAEDTDKVKAKTKTKASYPSPAEFTASGRKGGGLAIGIGPVPTGEGAKMHREREKEQRREELELNVDIDADADVAEAGSGTPARRTQTPRRSRGLTPRTLTPRSAASTGTGTGASPLVASMALSEGDDDSGGKKGSDKRKGKGKGKGRKGSSLKVSRRIQRKEAQAQALLQSQANAEAEAEAAKTAPMDQTVGLGGVSMMLKATADLTLAQKQSGEGGGKGKTGPASPAEIQRTIRARKAGRDAEAAAAAADVGTVGRGRVVRIPDETTPTERVAYAGAILDAIYRSLRNSVTLSERLNLVWQPHIPAASSRHKNMTTLTELMVDAVEVAIKYGDFARHRPVWVDEKGGVNYDVDPYEVVVDRQWRRASRDLHLLITCMLWELKDLLDEAHAVWSPGQPHPPNFSSLIKEIVALDGFEALTYGIVENCVSITWRPFPLDFVALQFQLLQVLLWICEIDEGAWKSVALEHEHAFRYLLSNPEHHERLVGTLPLAQDTLDLLHRMLEMFGPMRPVDQKAEEKQGPGGEAGAPGLTLPAGVSASALVP